MIDPSNTYIGLGTFYSEDMRYPNTTAGEFSYETGLDETQGTAVKDCVQILEFAGSCCSNEYRISGDVSAQADKAENDNRYFVQWYNNQKSAGNGSDYMELF